MSETITLTQDSREVVRGLGTDSIITCTRTSAADVYIHVITKDDTTELFAGDSTAEARLTRVRASPVSQGLRLGTVLGDHRYDRRSARVEVTRSYARRSVSRAARVGGQTGSEGRQDTEEEIEIMRRPA